MNQRGTIQNIARAQQINDFNALIMGTITPTDIDGLIEYRNKAYVFLEVKYLDKELPYGQRLALERLATDVSVNNKKSIVIVASHDVQDTAQGIDVAICPVRCYYLNGAWRNPIKDITVKDAIKAYIDKVVEGKII